MPQSETRKRTIRSFVKRTGRLTPSQERALTELWPDMGLAYAEVQLDLPTVFGRDAPVVLEIGFGNGESLVLQADESPDKDFIGIEVHDPGIGHCLLKAAECNLRNLRLLAHDAIDVLTHQVATESLQRINLYFPDPWPKKRHHKRRIVQPDFLDLTSERLCPGGALHIATDWAGYAEHIDEQIASSTRYTVDERREHGGERPLDRPQTKFERRGLKKGHQIVDWRLLKTYQG